MRGGATAEEMGSVPSVLIPPSIPLSRSQLPRRKVQSPLQFGSKEISDWLPPLGAKACPESRADRTLTKKKYELS